MVLLAARPKKRPGIDEPGPFAKEGLLIVVTSGPCAACGRSLFINPLLAGSVRRSLFLGHAQKLVSQFAESYVARAERIETVIEKRPAMVIVEAGKSTTRADVGAAALAIAPSGRWRRRRGCCDTRPNAAIERFVPG